MAGTMNTKLKTLYLMDILRENSDEEHVLSANDICMELKERYGIDAERKSIYTDLQILEEYGLDIVRVSSPKKGVYLGEREYELPELRLLTDAVQSASFISAKKTAEMTEKICSSLSMHERELVVDKVYINERTKTTNESVYYIIDALAKAIHEKRKVRLHYIRYMTIPGAKPSRAEQIFTLSPYALIWSDDHYYAICNNAKYDNFMSIRVERVKSVDVLLEPIRDCSEFSSYTDGFDVADYTMKNFNGFSGETTTVELLCDNDLLQTVIDRFGEDVSIRESDDDSFSIIVQAAISEGFLNWINQFGGKMVVLGPREIQEKLMERAASTLETYKKLTEEN